MNKKRSLLEKGMRDRRFRKSEAAILKTFSNEAQKGITMRKMAKKAGLGRSTMYIHHHAIREVIPDYQRYMLLEYNAIIRKKLHKKDIQLKTLYLDTLIFIFRNQKVFAMFLKFDNQKTLTKMIDKLKPVIVEQARLPKNSEKVFHVYTSEVVELISEWERTKFPGNEIERLIGDIMYLTNTMRDRLMPINR